MNGIRVAEFYTPQKQTSYNSGHYFVAQLNLWALHTFVDWSLSKL